MVGAPPAAGAPTPPLCCSRSVSQLALLTCSYSECDCHPKGRGGSTGRGRCFHVFILHHLKLRTGPKMHRIIKGRDEKGNLAIPYPRPNERRYPGKTSPLSFQFAEVIASPPTEERNKRSFKTSLAFPRKKQY